MKYIFAFSVVFALIYPELLSAAPETNSWGQILYTQYESSKIFYAPLTQSAVQGKLQANETVKADFKEGNWFAVFKPSEKVRSKSNAIGYMEAQDLFPNPLKDEIVDNVRYSAPPIGSSIESMKPISPFHSGLSYNDEVSYQQPLPVANHIGPSSQLKSGNVNMPMASVSWQEIGSIYSRSSKYTDLQKKELWKKYEGKAIEWNGNVAYMSDSWGKLAMQIKMDVDTWASDLIIFLKNSERDKALHLKKGDPVTFRGILYDWGTVTPITLDEGLIIK